MPRRLALTVALMLGPLIPAAMAQDMTDLLPLTARGNKPFWSLTLTGEGSRYTDASGLSLDAPFTAPASADGGLIFATAAGPLRLTETLCRDSMSGMPYPLSATLTRNGTSLPGCAGDPARLLAGDWMVTALDGKALPKGADVTLTFDAGRLSGFSACNRFSGSFTLTGEGLTLGPMAGTRMACPPPLMETESAVYAAFARVTQFDITPDGALLLNSDESTTLITATR